VGSLPRGKKNWPSKTCPICGSVFRPKKGHEAQDWEVIIYCSRNCSSKSRKKSLRETLLNKSVRNDISGCLEFMGGCDKKGYGRIRSVDLNEVLAHRISWILNYGKIPDGMHVLHKCDNPRCIEPSHLFIGTNNDNVKDKVLKGRQQRLYGERNGRAVLTNDDVCEIMESKLNNEECPIFTELAKVKYIIYAEENHGGT
jgi:hypothetical protein